MSKKIAFLFPGQGAQYVGMGKDFCDAYSEAREVFQQADEILKRSLSSIIFEGPAQDLTLTRNSQTGIYVTSLAILAVLGKEFPELSPHVCAGLSLGEYTAMTASGRLPFGEGLPLVQFRGDFMNEACVAFPGTMAVVMGLDAQKVETLVKEVNLPDDLWAANFNCPGQVVISGTSKGIQAGTRAALDAGAKRVLPLQVHGAFHSGLMQAAQNRLAPKIDECALLASNIRVVMNVPGDFCDDVNLIRQNLVRQVTQPVRWEQGIRAMAEDGIGLFVEIGCGKTLSGMNRKIQVPGSTLSVDKVGDLEALAAGVL